MALLKVSPAALKQFFSPSIYDLYYFEPEKPLRLAYENFNLAILRFIKSIFFKLNHE